MQQRSLAERRFVEESVEDRQADPAAEEWLGGIDLSPSRRELRDPPAGRLRRAGGDRRVPHARERHTRFRA
jgi:hypothetical protein